MHDKIWKNKIVGIFPIQNRTLCFLKGVAKKKSLMDVLLLQYLRLITSTLKLLFLPLIIIMGGKDADLYKISERMFHVYHFGTGFHFLCSQKAGGTAVPK